MRSGFLLVLSGMVLASAAVIATGCSEDPLNSGAQNLNLTYTPSPSGSGRFDDAEFSISLIQVVPADPEEALLLGNEQLRLRFDPFPADLALATPVTLSHISLSVGTWKVSQIAFSPLTLVDTDIVLPIPPDAECIDSREVINRGSVSPAIPQLFTFTSPQDDLSALTFTLQPGQTDLALTVDVPGLIDDYEAAFACQLQPCTGCPIDPRAVLTSFDNQAFRAALLANISFR